MVETRGVENNDLITVQDLVVGYAGTAVLEGVSFTLRPGEILSVIGPSGCGKSTLLGLLGGLDRDYAGSLRLFGTDASSLSDRELSRLRGERIGFVFQAFHLLEHLDVLSNVTAPSLFAATYEPRRVRERGFEVLERVKLADRAHASPASLSGGQRQRVAIARAIFHRPALLLCDEPTGNLDRDTGAQIIELFAALHQDLHTTIVIVTHEDRMGALEHRKLHMLDGQLTADGAQA
jgi:putative ABC transport system ATP-binding protein